MNGAGYVKRGVVAAAALTAATPGQAAVTTPRVMLEKGASYAADGQLRAFRVPTIDASGNVSYYDVTVQLKVDGRGVLSPTAAVTASPSPSVTTGVLPPGTYKGADGTSCAVRDMTLNNGRIQSFFACTRADALRFELSVATGAVSAGHPYLKDLNAAGIDKLADAGTYTWGRLTSGTFQMDSCFSANAPTPIGAKTDGDELVLYLFTKDQVRCSATFTAQ